MDRFVRDLDGRVVPASIAEAAILQRALQGDDERDLRLSAASHPYAAPLADIAGLGRDVREAGDLFKPRSTQSQAISSSARKSTTICTTIITTTYNNLSVASLMTIMAMRLAFMVDYYSSGCE